MPSRRQFLGVAAGVVATSAGCVSVPAGGSDPDDQPSPATSTTADTTITNASTTAHENEGPVRGGADPITVEETVTDPDYVYIESNDTVRYPATMSGGEVSTYGYEPFDDWAYTEGAVVAARAVRNQITEQVPEADSISVGVAAGDGDSLVLHVGQQTHLSRDGEVISEPDAVFSDIVDATPERATATIRFAGKARTNTYVTQVVETTLKND